MALSYSYTPRDVPYKYCTVKDILQDRLERHENVEAFIHYREDGSRDSLTYRDLDRKSKHLARYLISLGIKKGDRVALSGSNSMGMVIAEFAIMMTGALVVHISIRSTDASDAIDIVEYAKCKMVLVNPGQGTSLLEPVSNLIKHMQSKIKSEIQNPEEKQPSNVLLLTQNDNFTNSRTLDSVLNSDTEQLELPEIYPEDPFLVFSTSGSTGKPKMVVHTHFGIVHFQLGLTSSEGDDRIKKMYNDRPFTWVGGSPSVVMTLAESRIFTDTAIGTRGDSTEFIWNIVQSENCVYLVHVPYFILDLIAAKEKISTTFKVRYFATGGQPVRDNHLQVIESFCDTLVAVYGSTESNIVTHFRADDSKQEVDVGDVGLPMSGTEIKVVDEKGQVTRRNQRGEICIRNNVLFSGYLDMELSHTLLPGGWFKPGDMGYISDNGHVFITGRVKDVISRGTRKIMPASVEEVIRKMEGIEKVAVVAVPDERLLEEVCACFIAKKDHDVSPDDVKEYCMTAFLTDKAVDGLGEMPKYFLKFESFPLLATGKLNTISLKADAKAKLFG